MFIKDQIKYIASGEFSLIKSHFESLETPKMGNLANSDDPDKISQYAAFHFFAKT